MEDTVGTGHDWTRVPHSTMVCSSLGTTIQTSGTEGQSSSRLPTGLVGSQAASVATEIGTEPISNPGT